MIRALTPEELATLGGDAVEAGFGAIETEKGCLPLRSLDVDVAIDGVVAATTVRQQFVNVFSEPLEATYIFPLPPRAAVTGFRMSVDGTVILGRIDERAQARQDYAAAVAAGRHAAIVEEERSDVFTLRVGNIPPRSVAVVEFTLAAPVAIDHLEATYRFPLVVAPRYCPGTPLGDAVGDGVAADTDRVPDASRLSPPVLLPGLKSPVRLGITVRLTPQACPAAADGEAIGCSLPVEEAADTAVGRTVRVVPGQRLDRDFILRWNVAAELVATAGTLVEPDAARAAGLGTGLPNDEAAGDGTFAVTVVPAAATLATQPARDVVFVVDRSGSMMGWKMLAARRAVARMIDSLSAQDRVAAIAFDHTIEHRGAGLELVPATDRNRWQLVEWLAGIDARGGTELAAALGAGLGLCGAATAEARERFVVLVTDGQVGDEDDVLREMAGKLGSTRLFVVGIDNAVNEGLIARLADASGGLVELVESEARLDDVMDRIQSRIVAPLVTNLRLIGQGIDVVPGSIVPARMPDLVAGVPLVVHGRYRGAAGGRIVVEGVDAAGKTWRADAPVAGAATAGLGSLWARGRLRQLEDAYATGGDHDGGDFDRRIVSLSMSFGVLCRFTALVAIDERTPDQFLAAPPMRSIVQPVEMPHPGMLYRRAAPLARAMLEPGFVLGYEDGPAAACPPPSPVDQARSLAERLVRGPWPRRRGGRGPSAKRVRMLLTGTSALIRRLGRCGAEVETVERIGAAYARLLAWPTDPAALVALLDAIADSLADAGAVERWWLAPQAWST